MISAETHCKLLRVVARMSLKSQTVTSESSCQVVFSYIHSYIGVFTLCVQKSFYHIRQNDIFTSNIHNTLVIMIMLNAVLSVCPSIRPSVASVIHAQMDQDIKIHFTSYNIVMFLDLGVEKKLINTAQ